RNTTRGRRGHLNHCPPGQPSTTTTTTASSASATAQRLRTGSTHFHAHQICRRRQFHLEPHARRLRRTSGPRRCCFGIHSIAGSLGIHACRRFQPRLRHHSRHHRHELSHGPLLMIQIRRTNRRNLRRCNKRRAIPEAVAQV